MAVLPRNSHTSFPKGHCYWWHPLEARLIAYRWKCAAFCSVQVNIRRGKIAKLSTGQRGRNTIKSTSKNLDATVLRFLRTVLKLNFDTCFRICRSTCHWSSSDSRGFKQCLASLNLFIAISVSLKGLPTSSTWLISSSELQLEHIEPHFSIAKIENVFLGFMLRDPTRFIKINVELSITAPITPWRSFVMLKCCEWISKWINQWIL